MSQNEKPEDTEGTYEPPVAENYEAPRILIESAIEQDVLDSPPGGGEGPGVN